jgi:hypothetical protein
MRPALLALALSTLLCAQTPSLLVKTDAECQWSVDGEPQGLLKAGGEARLNLPPGEHSIEAVALAGGPRWKETLRVENHDQTVAIPLKATIARADAERLGYWIDPITKIVWAASDNGSGVTWSQAVYYCRSLNTANFKDWGLPSIEELKAVYGGPADSNGRHVMGPITLTGWAWSSSPGAEPGEQWALDFGDGGRASVVTGDSGLNRALCVRHSAVAPK